MKVLGITNLHPRSFCIVKCGPCPVCGKVTELTLATSDVIAWQDGGHIQNVMPYLTATERETLISGVCSDECWERATL